MRPDSVVKVYVPAMYWLSPSLISNIIIIIHSCRNRVAPVESALALFPVILMAYIIADHHGRHAGIDGARGA